MAADVQLPNERGTLAFSLAKAKIQRISLRDWQIVPETMTTVERLGNWPILTTESFSTPRHSVNLFGRFEFLTPLEHPPFMAFASLIVREGRLDGEPFRLLGFTLPTSPFITELHTTPLHTNFTLIARFIGPPLSENLSDSDHIISALRTGLVLLSYGPRELIL